MVFIYLDFSWFGLNLKSIDRCPFTFILVMGHACGVTTSKVYDRIPGSPQKLANCAWPSQSLFDNFTQLAPFTRVREFFCAWCHSSPALLGRTLQQVSLSSSLEKYDRTSFTKRIMHPTRTCIQVIRACCLYHRQPLIQRPSWL
jgi:hypothetical protein